MVTKNNIIIPTPASGKLILGGGVGSPSVASTASYPSTASTSGNRMQSNGSDFSIVAPTYTPYYFSIQTTRSGTLSDAATCFLGTGVAPEFYASATGSQRFVMPKAGTLKRVDVVGSVNGTLASAGNCIVRYYKNGGAAVDIITTFSLTSANNSVSATLSLALVAGDFLTFGILTPTWATNPVQVSFSLGAIIT